MSNHEGDPKDCRACILAGWQAKEDLFIYGTGFTFERDDGHTDRVEPHHVFTGQWGQPPQPKPPEDQF